ncbi:MFS transporter [Bacillus sp. SA1-12]|uniref:MFS transporter n=1 Tax=Bacillus sp. SA1-12 TaxID=1455638 RepID=UPI000A07C424|nr:MFS transporter [Bacillus sp. SA1-12]
MDSKSSTIYFFFIILYAVAYMGNAVFQTFLPVYLDSIDLSKTEIAALLSFGPLMAILAQPIWGSIGDRSKTKNSVLQLLMFGSALSVLFFPLSNHFVYLLVIMCLVTFFQTSVYPMGDAITLEYLSETKWNFGPIRLAGTIGFALMSVGFGLYARNQIDSIFIVYCLIMLLAMVISFKLPKVKGHQASGNKVKIWVVFKNRKLVLLLLLSFIVQVSLGYYYAFFPIFYKELGADTSLLGWSMLVSASSEIPFLLFADKIIKRFGVPLILLSTAFFAGVRWLCFYFVESPYLVLPIQLFHGAIFIVLMVTMAMFINEEVPRELKASGQTMYGLISLGIARITGSILGGMTAESVGMREVFLYSSILMFLTLIVFAFIFMRDVSFAKKSSAKTS